MAGYIVVVVRLLAFCGYSLIILEIYAISNFVKNRLINNILYTCPLITVMLFVRGINALSLSCGIAAQVLALAPAP